ncbi:MAG: hypothetical protein HYS59_00795 [Candidatus Vogelbacteria bacterium]|nr:hypothetical protein [Candidatus Vogelbacteria bacterium]
MTLATHILIAGAAARPLFVAAPLPVVFTVSLLSHYLIDAVPHGDYILASVNDSERDPMKRVVNISSKTVAPDLIKITLDISIGSALLYFLTNGAPTLAYLLPFTTVVVGGILPDLLQPLYYFWKKPPMTHLQAFHKFIHTDVRLRELGYIKTAIISQLCIVGISIAAILYL